MPLMRRPPTASLVRLGIGVLVFAVVVVVGGWQAGARLGITAAVIAALGILLGVAVTVWTNRRRPSGE
jgi:hypothetical protein